MRPDILVLHLRDGALLIGPAQSLNALAAEAGDHGGRHRWRLRSLLAHRVDPWRLRAVALAWGIDHPHRRHWSDKELQDQVAHWVETGRLGLRFLPLFRDDPRGPHAGGQLSLFQIGKGPPPSVSPLPPPAASVSPPAAVLSRSSDTPATDYPNESDQAATLKKAARSGRPFCAQCEAIKKRLDAERAGAAA
jgi:hypothetical protein